MKLLRRLSTHLLTAVLTAAITSLYWYGVYGAGGSMPASPRGKVLTETTRSAGKQQLVLGPSGLAIPVAGMTARDLIDTYGQARAGGARLHDAIDIMAPRGTPVVAAAPGVVEKMFVSEGGGITVYVRSPDKQWIYYYAHLQDYAPGLTEGQKVDRGAPLGTVGSSGNANPEGPHLHFAVHKMDASDDWHGGEPVNPYPLLARRATSG